MNKTLGFSSQVLNFLELFSSLQTMQMYEELFPELFSTLCPQCHLGGVLQTRTVLAVKVISSGN